MTETAKRIKAKYAGPCGGCSRMVNVGDAALYYNKKVYCSDSCLPEGVEIGERREGKPQEEKKSQPYVEDKRMTCDCGRTFNYRDGVRVVTPGGNITTICPDCGWLMEAHRKLKYKGLWAANKAQATGGQPDNCRPEEYA